MLDQKQASQQIAAASAIRIAGGEPTAALHCYTVYHPGAAAACKIVYVWVALCHVQ